jgi:two-component system chemotaxis response regulator CheB
MGSDGAAELKALKDLGAITIAQDAESSAVHGMPGAAIQLGGATHILSPDKIAQMLSQYADNQTPRLDVSIP